MAPPPSARHRERSQRIALLSLIAVLGVFITGFSYIEFRQQHNSEKRTLVNQAKLVSVNLGLHMRSANRVLDEIQALHGLISMDEERERMQLLVNAMPIIRGIGLLDSKGAQVAGTRLVAAGSNFSDRPYFRNVQLDPQHHRLYISKPFRSLTGQFSIALSKAILNGENEFAGVVFAILEPDYLEILMSSTLYTADMWAILAHKDSPDFLWVGAHLPTTEDADSGSQGKLDGLFSALTDSAYAPFFWEDGGAGQIVAASTVGSYAGNVEHPLTILVGRSYDAAIAGWLRLAYIQGGVFLLFAVTIYGGLVFYQHRRRQYDETHAADLRMIEAREHDYRLIVEHTTDCVVRLDCEGKLVYTNSAFTTLFGSAQAGLHDFAEIVLEADRGAAYSAVQRALEHNGEQRLQVKCSALNGVHHMEWVLCSIPGDDGNIVGVIGVGRDVSAHIAQNLELRTRAEHDSLTGLANRGHFLEVAGVAVEQAHHHGHSLSLMMIDLDHFKQINDTWGHHAGDIALQVCARTLREHCRDTDIAARLGGEEFTLLMQGAQNEAMRVAERLCHAIASTPIVVDEACSFELTASIGVAVLQANEPVDRLLQRADSALYNAKENGRNCVTIAPDQ